MTIRGRIKRLNMKCPIVVTATRKEDIFYARIMQDFMEYNWNHGGRKKFMEDAKKWVGTKGTC